MLQTLPSCLECLSFYVGLIVIIYTFLRLISRFILPPFNLYERYGGGWAVVTGGSDGIGQGFCQQLAKLGFNICIISRTRQKMDKICENIKKVNSKIQTKTLSVDFANSFKPDFYQNIMKQIKDLDISILVNNVGALNTVGLFCENKPQDIFKQSTLNMMPVAMMTRHLLPLMLKRQKKAGIITLSSYSMLLRLKYSVNYCASKLFDDRFSRSLQYEYSDKIDFLSVRPVLVTTQMTRNITSFLHVSKNSCARGALKALGRYSHYSGHWWHQLQVFATELIVQPIRDKILGYTWQNIGEKYKDIDNKKQKKN